VIPFPRIPGLSRARLEMANGSADRGGFPDSPTVAAATARGREILGRRPAPELGPGSFRFRGDASRRAAELLLGGRAVAIAAGQQVGVMTGPLFTLVKALAAIEVAARLTRDGVPAAALFWMATEDHDLPEVARIDVPSATGPKHFRFDDARQINRIPVGRLRLPDRVAALFEDPAVLEAAAGSGEILARFADRCAPGRTYGEAFAEILLDLAGDRPLLLFDPLDGTAAGGHRRLFRQVLEAPPEGEFPFFLIDAEGRHKVLHTGAGRFELKGQEGSNSSEDLLRQAEALDVLPSPNYRLRPVLQAQLFPVAAEILGPSELAYHAEVTPLYDRYGTRRPVYLPRPIVVPLGKREQRYAHALGLSEEALLEFDRAARSEVPAVAGSLAGLAGDIDEQLRRLSPAIRSVDPTLEGALETARTRVAYQVGRLKGKIERAALRRDGERLRRLQALQTWLLPGGHLAERVYTPLSWLLRFGDPFVDRLAEALDVEAAGAIVIPIEGG
jgi:bacillithiol synthase